MAMDVIKIIIYIFFFVANFLNSDFTESNRIANLTFKNKITRITYLNKTEKQLSFRCESLI